jgi:ketosteroid isomerase-like protein
MMEAIEAFNRGDLEAMFQGYDREVNFEHRLADLQGTFVGIDAVKGWFADALEAFDGPQIECPDIRDLGDRVLALGIIRATGQGSGAETELPFTVLATFKDGLVTHFVDYGDRGKALEAAGLSE